MIEYPDATLVLVSYLSDRMPVPVYSRIPRELPDEFVRVRRVGGLRKSLVEDRPRFDVHFWGPSEQRAEELMRRGRALVLAMAGPRYGTTVYRVREAGGPQWLPDPETSHPRYAIAFEMSLRGRRLEM